MDVIDSINQNIKGQPKKPPLHLWHPPLSGAIDILIKANGEWFHEGDKIARHSLVTLFASILRREEDNEYYLVTPVEKWQIRVEDSPLLAISMAIKNEGKTSQKLTVTTNVGDDWLLSAAHPLIVDASSITGEPNPKVKLDNNLTAKLNRNVFYELANYAIADEDGYFVLSEGERFSLGPL